MLSHEYRRKLFTLSLNCYHQLHNQEFKGMLYLSHFENAVFGSQIFVDPPEAAPNTGVKVVLDRVVSSLITLRLTCR